MNNSVIVVGGGISGMTAAGILAQQGYNVTLIERENITGGHVANWDRLFPDRKKASEVLDFIAEGMKNVKVVTGINVTGITRTGEGFTVSTSLPDKGPWMQDAGSGMQDAGSGMQDAGYRMQDAGYRMQDPQSLTPNPQSPTPNPQYTSRALLLATGFDLFEARKKEEYGYGIYNNVITSAELEKKFKSGGGILTSEGKIPSRIGIVHCVGSRDEKVGNLYCSKVCCVTGVKQAIELKEMYPSSAVFNFYMDLRMFDRYFEELYYEAQQKWGVSFIRGRLSECAENPDGSIVVKTEDTLSGKPLKMTVDLLILLAGFVPSSRSASLVDMLGLERGCDGFVSSADSHVKNNSTSLPGLFLAGALKGPSSISEAIADARAAAMQIAGYLKSRSLVND